MKWLIVVVLVGLQVGCNMRSDSASRVDDNEKPQVINEEDGVSNDLESILRPVAEAYPFFHGERTELDDARLALSLVVVDSRVRDECLIVVSVCNTGSRPQHVVPISSLHYQLYHRIDNSVGAQDGILEIPPLHNAVVREQDLPLLYPGNVLMGAYLLPKTKLPSHGEIQLRLHADYVVWESRLNAKLESPWVGLAKKQDVSSD